MQRAEVPAAPLAAAAVDEDRELVEQARGGDAGAFEALVRRYQGWVFTLALRMVGNRAEAEDVAQEVFLKAYRGLAGFKAASRFTTWLYAIASHHCLNHLQARSRRSAPAGRGRSHAESDAPVAVERLPDGAPRADALLERTDFVRIVQAEMTHLTEEHRLILVLRDIQGLSYEDIARTLGLELGTVRSRLHRARMEMKARLTPYL
ncbi:MAG: sigma-70 family RNA polymerase sigma factor [candidate division NC10 bacterium]|nr:sigma-70 family RNA polymerase sigma factor [candidate division NC10 bacterium]